jgi:hypothetical protein
MTRLAAGLVPDERVHQLRVDRERAGGYEGHEVHDALPPQRTEPHEKR